MLKRVWMRWSMDGNVVAMQLGRFGDRLDSRDSRASHGVINASAGKSNGQFHVWAGWMYNRVLHLIYAPWVPQLAVRTAPVGRSGQVPAWAAWQVYTRPVLRTDGR